jgi:hypothetical protein
MSKQIKPSVIFATGSGPMACHSAIDLTLRAEEHDVIAGHHGFDTLAGNVAAEFARTYNVQAHEIIDVITAVVLNAEAGLNLLRAQSPDLENVRKTLSSIANDGKRAGDVIVRTRALMNKVAAADGATHP